MKCEEFEVRLNEVLDARDRPELTSELRQHCETCRSCREIASAYGIMLDGFYLLTTPEAPVDLSARVLAALNAEPMVTVAQPAHSRRAMWAASLLATAAAVLLVVLPLVQRSRNGVVAVAQPQAKPTPTQIATHPRVAVPATVSPQLEEIPLIGSMLASLANQKGNPYEELAKGTGQGLATLVLYVPGVGGQRGIMDKNRVPREDDPAWVSQMNEGLKPVTESVTETLDLLLQALPVTQLAGRS